MGGAGEGGPASFTAGGEAVAVLKGVDLNTTRIRVHLLASTVLAGALALSTTAHAQTANPNGAVSKTETTGAQVTPAEPGSSVESGPVGEVVVTGSILTRRNAISESPLTVLSADDIEKRGETTIQSVIQNLSNNGSGALPNNFSAGGAFAAGASGASLRGLTTNSTLVLIDGLRAAYYPLADDGKRNFVDLNTIPDTIVDRVEVLKDGASSTYGADAIGGVINIITKRNFQGLQLRAEGGTSERGGADTKVFSGLAGRGDISTDGYNMYLSAEYEKDDQLYFRERGYPYNTSDLSRMCGTSIAPPGSPNVVNGQTCRANSIVNGIQFNNAFTGVGSNFVAVVRPYNAANTAAQGDFRLLNPTLGCPSPSVAVTVTPAQAALGGAAGISAPVTLCQTDTRKLYNTISPEYERFSTSFHLTKQLGADAQAYFQANYYQNDVHTSGAPNAIRATTTPAATGITATTTSLPLPVYVCPTGSATFTCSATSPGAVLNPNNPFAANNQVARIFYSFGDLPNRTEEISQVYRLAGGVNGNFNFSDSNYRYTADFTYMQSDLKRVFNGNLFVSHLLTAVNQGSYNFANPSLNSKAVRDFIAPQLEQFSSSELAEGQVTIARDLFHLWAPNPVQFGVGASVRYESVYNPSANSDVNGPTERFFSINPFGAIGARNVESVDFELDIPVIRQLEVNFSGRYDNYSTGQDNFSPKIGGKLKPLSWLTFRSTYSEGFRIPSFAESFAVPNTGFVPANAPAAFNALHGNDGYGNYNLGRTVLSNPNLQPESSENFNVGFVIEPIRNISFSADYYRIKKTGVIEQDQTYTAAVNNYFATGQLTYQGHVISLAPVDPNFPNAPAVPLSVTTSLVNLEALTTSGYDLAATARYTLPYGVQWTSTGEATYVLRLNEILGDGTTLHFAGTLGPSDPTAGSGTPKWRASWQNTLAYGPFTLSGTVYYTSGYSSAAEDAGDTSSDCSKSVYAGKFRDNITPVVCNVKSFTTVDLHATWQATKNFQFYLDVLNLFDKNAPLDATAYGGGAPYLYNPAWASAGVLGRYFKVGAKATF